MSPWVVCKFVNSLSAKGEANEKVLVVRKYEKPEFFHKIKHALRILTPPMETPDPPNDTCGALKQVVLTPHDIPWSLRVL